jgi:hypothetical protein
MPAMGEVSMPLLHAFQAHQWRHRLRRALLSEAQFESKLSYNWSPQYGIGDNVAAAGLMDIQIGFTLIGAQVRIVHSKFLPIGNAVGYVRNEGPELAMPV